MNVVLQKYPYYFTISYHKFAATTYLSTLYILDVFIEFIECYTTIFCHFQLTFSPSAVFPHTPKVAVP